MRHWLEGPLKKSKKKGHLTIGIANGETFSSHCEDKIFSDLNFDVFDLIIDCDIGEVKISLNEI